MDNNIEDLFLKFTLYKQYEIFDKNTGKSAIEIFMDKVQKFEKDDQRCNLVVKAFWDSIFYREG
jgi:hypothetical protein